MKLTIIGAGSIGSAIAYGIGNSKAIDAKDIYCTAHTQETLEKVRGLNSSINVMTDNVKAVVDADIVMLAVKPWLVESVINEIKSTLDYKKVIFVSIAAGIDFEQLGSFLRKEGEDLPVLFRIIPNTAIAVRESVSFISAYNASEEQISMIVSLFDELGKTFLIEERLMRAGTALASCGIAYAFRYIRAAVEGGVELGLYPDLAQEIEMQTLKGAIKLLETNSSHPEVEIDKVTTPGGFTIKGLNAMEASGFTTTVINGLKASV